MIKMRTRAGPAPRLRGPCRCWPLQPVALARARERRGKCHNSQNAMISSSSRCAPGRPITEIAWSMPPLATPTCRSHVHVNAATSGCGTEHP
jgi:hypothetical protein